MSVKHLFIVGIALLFISCKKQNPVIETGLVKIKHIDNKSIDYEGDRITKIGEEKFFYDSKGKLAQSRIITSGLSYDRIIIGGGTNESHSISFNTRYVYSYHWEHNNVKQIKLDSMIVEQNKDGEISIIEKLVNQPYCEFLYDDNRLTSLSYINYSGKDPLTFSIFFQYDAKGNINQVDYHSWVDNRWAPSPYLTVTKVFYDEYDDKRNPFAILHQALGTLTPSILEWNISPNNPVKARQLTDTRLEAYQYINYSYQYNQKDLPTEVKMDKENQFPKTNYSIEYYD